MSERDRHPLADLRTAAQEVIGGKATTLDSPLLR